MDFSTNLSLYLVFITIASPLGIPLGATFFIISAGSQSLTLEDLLFFVSLIFLCLVIGDIAAYKTGSYFEKIITQKVCKYERIRNKCDKSRDIFNKYGGSSLFFSRFFFLGFGAPVNYISGFSKYSFRKFLVLSASGEFIYALIYTSIGFIFRDSWIFLLDTIFDLSLTIILFLCTLFAAYRMRQYIVYDNSKTV